MAWTLAAAAGLALSCPTQAQWKWRDAQGQIHVSDIPPPRGIPDKDVLQRADASAKTAAPAAPAPAAPAASAVVAKAAVDPELEKRKHQAEQEQEARRKAEEKKVAAQRQDNCRRARDHLALLDSGQRIARIGADGERVILDDTARAQQAQQARQVIASDCR